MSKLTFAIAALFLAGCASTSGWRTLSIDASSEAAFNESLALMDGELPRSHSQMLALALVDIVESGKNADQAYTIEEFRAQLAGLNYEGVIALADQTGPSISNQYYAGRRTAQFEDRYGGLPGPAPTFFGDQGGPAPNAWSLSDRQPTQ